MPLLICFLGERYGWVPPPAYRRHAGLALSRFDFLRRLPEGLSLTHIELLYAYFWKAPSGAQGDDGSQGKRGWKHCSFYLRDPSGLLHDVRFLERCDQDDERLKLREKEEFEKSVRAMEAAHEAAKREAKKGPKGAVDQVLIQLIEGSDLASCLAEEEEEEDGEEEDKASDEDEKGEAQRKADEMAAAEASRGAAEQGPKKKKGGFMQDAKAVLRHVLGAPKEGGKGKRKGKKHEQQAPGDELPPLDEGEEDGRVAGGPGAREKMLQGKKTENVILKAGVAGGAMALAGAGAAALLGGGGRSSREDDEEEDEEEEEEEDDDDDDDDDGSMVSGASFGGLGFLGRKNHDTRRGDGAGADVADSDGDDGGRGGAPGVTAAFDPSNEAVSTQRAASANSSRGPLVQPMQEQQQGSLPSDVRAGTTASDVLSSCDGSSPELIRACIATWMQSVRRVVLGSNDEVLCVQRMALELANGSEPFSTLVHPIDDTVGDVAVGGGVEETALVGPEGIQHSGEGIFKNGNGSNIGGEQSEGKKWLPRFRDPKTVQAAEMEQLAATARRLQVDFEIVKVAHDLLDMVEVSHAGGGGERKDDAVTTDTSRYLQVQGKTWPTLLPQLLSQTDSTSAVPAAPAASAPAAAQAQGGHEGVSWLGITSASHVPSSLPVYVLVKVGDQVARTDVVWSEGLLEKGFLGGEW
jgi:ribosomal protein L12E/L44/L45/RPP1/RPP2